MEQQTAADGDYLTVQVLYNASIGFSDAENLVPDDSSTLPEFSADEVEQFMQALEDCPADGGVYSSPCTTVAIGDRLPTDALQYLAGYVAFKLKRQHPELGSVSSQVCPAPSSAAWIHILSRGGLRQPTDLWFRQVQNLEEEFQQFHGSDLRKERHVVQNLVNILTTRYPNVPEVAIACFVKTRTMIRLRQVNRKRMNTKHFVNKKNEKGHEVA